MAKDGKPRILITRLSHLGDAILTLPLVCRLRDALPDAFLAWAAEPATCRLLRGHPAIDELIEVPRAWMKRWRGLLRLRRTLRERRIEVALDPQSLLKSSALAWLSGAPTRIGFGGVHGRELSTRLNNRLVRPRCEHLLDRTLELLGPMGIDPGDQTPQFQLAVDEASLRWAQAAIAHFRGTPLVLINPGAGWVSRRWPADRFAAIAGWLHENWGYRSIVAWAGEEERSTAAEIVTKSSQASVLAPATNLQQLMALLKACEFYLGGDTGPMHLAAAIGVTCVALFGPTRPEACGPYGKGHCVIRSPISADADRAGRKRSTESMRSISVEQVCRELHSFLAERQARRASTS